MKLTKEECQCVMDVAKYLSVVVEDEDGTITYGSKFDKTVVYSLLGRLINEHFNLKPYEFEDLKPGMWVWDNKLEVYYQISFDEDIGWVYFWYDDGLFDVQCASPLEFEPNRFYAREIEEGMEIE